MSNGKTDWEILKKVAELSPKHYGEIIVKRNQTALDMIKDGHSGDIFIGCPHCNENYKCTSEKCIYVKVLKSLSNHKKWDNCECPCCELYFNGVKYEEEIRSFLHICCCRMYVNYYIDDYPKIKDKIIRFLKGHIEWGKKDYWGKKYKINLPA